MLKCNLQHATHAMSQFEGVCCPLFLLATVLTSCFKGVTTPPRDQLFWTPRWLRQCWGLLVKEGRCFANSLERPF